MTAGRPTKPVEQKRRLGNPGGRPLPEPVTTVEAFVQIPPPPDRLQDRGRAAWETVWRHAIAWIAPTDVPFIELLCDALDERDRLRDTVTTQGMVFMTDKGYLGVHPAQTELRKLDAQITSWLALLGLTPADRSRLGFAEVKRATKLADLRARQESMAAAPPQPDT